MNPYALYIKCGGSMNYDSKNPGGVSRLLRTTLR
jgi:hypothetical protein